MICILLVAGHGTILETQIKVSSSNVAVEKEITSLKQCKVRFAKRLSHSTAKFLVESDTFTFVLSVGDS